MAVAMVRQSKPRFVRESAQHRIHAKNRLQRTWQKPFALIVNRKNSKGCSKTTIRAQAAVRLTKSIPTPQMRMTTFIIAYGANIIQRVAKRVGARFVGDASVVAAEEVANEISGE